MTENELLPWHIQYWRLGIVTWHGWVVKHEYILHRAFLFDFIFRCGATVWMNAGVKSRGRRQTERAIGPSRSCCHTSSHNWSSAGVKRWPSATRSEPPSATLDILFDDHAAVSEERAGQWLQECPSVGARVKCLHAAEGWTLAAHDASRGVDLPVQNDGAA